MIKLAPSLLAADMLDLKNELEKVVSCGADMLHYDVMDAHLVPNLSFGPGLCKQIHAAFPALPLHVHLMMDNPGMILDAFAAAGASDIILHVEAAGDMRAMLRAIRERGIRCGLSLKPGTDVSALYEYLDEIDSVLIMTVEPGFGGQKMMPEQLKKAAALRVRGFAGEISVDGGITPENARMAIKAGIDTLVMGTAFFKGKDPGNIKRDLNR